MLVNVGGDGKVLLLAAACDRRGVGRPTSVVPIRQAAQYRTADAAKKTASLHRDVQKPKDQQQQQGEVPHCRLWIDWDCHVLKASQPHL